VGQFKQTGKMRKCDEILRQSYSKAPKSI